MIENTPPPDQFFYRVGFINKYYDFVVDAYYKIHSDALTAVRARNSEHDTPVKFKCQKWFAEKWVKVYE